MAFTPCPCMTLQNGVQYFAIVDAVICCIRMFYALFDMAKVVVALSDEDSYFQGSLIFFAIATLAAIAAQFILSVMLYKGASKRVYKLCFIWIILALIFTCAGVIIVCTFTQDFIVWLVPFIYPIYEIVVVAFFLKELKAEENSAKVGKDLEVP